MTVHDFIGIGYPEEKAKKEAHKQFTSKRKYVQDVIAPKLGNAEIVNWKHLTES